MDCLQILIRSKLLSTCPYHLIRLHYSVFLEWLNTYLNSFNESDITAPLRMLLKQDATWEWCHEHTVAIETLKSVLTQKPTLKFYDVQKPVCIQADSSQHGLGACLLQEGQPVAYASRALTSAEVNYAQLEKELLAICFACSKFYQYIYGKQVDVQSDHKPLEVILKKPIAKASPRVQRMVQRLQSYNLNVRYTPGKEMYLADTLSRAYIKGEPNSDFEDDIEVMVHSVINDIPSSPGRLEEIRHATQDDISLQQLSQVVRHGWPESRKVLPPDVQPDWHIRDEITIVDGLLLAGSRLTVPASLRSGILKLLHESHLGSDKAKGAIYWPNINRDIESVVAKCATCLKFRPAQVKEPLIPHEIPEIPFQKVAMDIMTYQGHDYLVLVDYYSKYPELARLSYGKSASVIITHLNSIFARHGIPEVIVADNMPFNSLQFRQFASEWGIQVNTSSPRYPQSNGQAERFVGIIKCMLKKAEEDGRDPYVALLEYRTTPVSGLPYSPAQMAMSRQLRTKLPVHHNTLKPSVVYAKSEHSNRQSLYKSQYDKSSKPLGELQPGDIIRHNHNGRWEPAIVKRRAEAPRSYIIQHSGGELRRNRKHLMITGEPAPMLTAPPDIELCGNSRRDPVDSAPGESTTTPSHDQSNEATPTSENIIRSKRQRRMPAYLAGYVTK